MNKGIIKKLYFRNRPGYITLKVIDRKDHFLLKVIGIDGQFSTIINKLDSKKPSYLK